jgi:1-acyl-sn-glycerol-3-phosphate acyltransferase
MALILVRPHTSLLDGPVVALHLRKVGIQAVFAVDPDYARHPVWSRLLNAYGLAAGGHTMLPLDTSRPYAVRTIDRLLDQGRDVVIFPQGTGLGDPDRPDAKGVDWLVERTFKQDGKVYRVERLTRQLTLSHAGVLPCVMESAPPWWLFKSAARLRMEDHFLRQSGQHAHV